MNKKTLIKKIRTDSPFDKENTGNAFNRILELIKKNIIEEEHFTVDGFGSFNVEHRKQQRMLDFRKKSEILLPPKDKITFSPSEKLLNGLNRRYEQK